MADLGEVDVAKAKIGGIFLDGFVEDAASVYGYEDGEGEDYEELDDKQIIVLVRILDTFCFQSLNFV